MWLLPAPACLQARFTGSARCLALRPLRHSAWLRRAPESRSLPLTLAASASPSESAPGSASHPEGAHSPLGPINKRPIELTERTYAYVLANTREHEVLRKCREDTASVHGAHMQIPPEQGALMGLLLESMGAVNAIELGTFTGYSSTVMALALPPHGKVVTCDKDAEVMAFARKYWAAAGVEHKVDARAGNGLDTLDALLSEGQENAYDFAFVDADKRAYGAYYDRLMRLVRPGGLIAVDNTLFYGKLADLAVMDKQTVALREFNARVLGDERVTHALVPVGDGLTLLRRRV